MIFGRCTCLLTFWTSYLVSVVNANVETELIKGMLSNESWSRQENIEIRDGNEYHHVHSVFDEPNAITPENVNEKIRHLHQFLSCEYAFLLTQFCDYTIRIGNKYKTTEDPWELLTYLENYLKNVKDSHPLIVRMIGALSYFIRISPNNVFNRQVMEILGYFKDSYDGYTFNDWEMSNPVGGVNSLKVLVHIQRVVDQNTSVVRLLRMFFMYNCRFTLEYGTQVQTFFSKLNIENNPDVRLIDEQSVDEINQTLIVMLNKTIELYYDNLGFILDPVSNTTRHQRSSLVGEIGDTAPNLESVDDLNIFQVKAGLVFEIFSTYEFSIVYCQRIHNVCDLFHETVTTENFDRKIRQAHQALSCDFAEHLGTLVHYVRGMALQCRRFSNPISSYTVFLESIEESKLLPVSMKGAFLYFYEMSTQTVHHTGLSVIVDYIICYFNNLVNDSVPSESGDLDVVLNELRSIESTLSFIEKYVRSFYHKFCSPVDRTEKMSGISLHADAVKDITEMNRGSPPAYAVQALKRNITDNIDQFTKHFQHLGFTYLQASSRVRFYPGDVVQLF